MSGTTEGADWYPLRPVDDRAHELAARYADLVGAAPAGVWAAPGRVNLIGEHVDYNGGLCLPMALPQTTLVAAGARDDARLVAHSAQRPGEPVEIALADVGPGRPNGWGGYVAGAVAMLLDGADGADGVSREAFGLTAVVDSDVPVGAGLSSSAALSCSTILAADELAGTHWAATDAGRARLVDACVRAENEVAQAPTGGMDQAAALRCSPGHALLLDCRDGSVEQVPFDLAAEDLALLVIDTRAEHSHSGGEYADRRAGCEAAARELGVTTLREVVDAPLDETLRRLSDDGLKPLVRHVVCEIRRVREVVGLLRAGLLREIGPVLDASHVSLRDDYRVSAKELDLAVYTARVAGALGARMTGGGFGGSAIALVPADAANEVADHVHASFTAAGLRPPGFLLAQPAAAGHRVG
ncbi:MAG TPA: galactokinase family protein [Angustibacter sp.]|nr:galactokinase family protein [Angustibacter sp.]